MRWSITGTTTSAVQPCCAIALSVSSGSNLRRMTSVVLSAMPSVKCAKPQEWNIGAASIVCSRARSGIMLNSAAAGSSDSGWRRWAPLGLPVVPLVRMTTRPFWDGGSRSVVSPSRMRSSRRGSSAGLVGVVPRDEPRAAPARVVDEVLELGVVDDRRRLLALGDLGDLRPGERGVEVQGVGAELRQRDRRVDEAAVVAAHDRDARALPDPAGAQRVGQRVRALGDLGERERPEVVDERRGVRVADRADGVAGGRRGAEAAQRAQRLDDPVRARRRHDPGARQRAGREEFLPDPVLGGHGTET